MTGGDPEGDFFEYPVPGDPEVSMDARVTRLEAQPEDMRADLAQIKAGQISMQESIRALAQATQDSIQRLTMAIEKVATEAKLSEGRLTSAMKKLAMDQAMSESRLTAAIGKVASEAALGDARLEARIKELPTKSDLRNDHLQAIGIGIAVLILVVTGIAGGLIFIKNG